MRRTIVLLAISALTALTAAATVAQAAAPVTESLSVDGTFTWDECGFAIEEHDVGVLRFISWYDESGARTRQIVTAPGFRITWTNPATGASVTSVNPFVVHKTDNPDGTVTIAFTGLQFVIPGGGRVDVSTGRMVIVLSSGGIELVSSVGPSADLCTALASAIA